MRRSGQLRHLELRVNFFWPRMKMGFVPNSCRGRPGVNNLRVGAGGVLLNHRSPYRVAETFLQLHARFPRDLESWLGWSSPAAGPAPARRGYPMNATASRSCHSFWVAGEVASPRARWPSPSKALRHTRTSRASQSVPQYSRPKRDQTEFRTIFRS